MDRCSKSIVLVLVGAPLLLGGCKTREEREAENSSYGYGGGYVGTGGAVGSYARPRPGSTATPASSPRGGFGFFGRIGSFFSGGG